MPQEKLAQRGGCWGVANADRRQGDAMTGAEIAILSVLIVVVVVSLWLGFLNREF
jgi:hypothetical protein